MTWRLIVTPKVHTALRTLPPQTKRYIRHAFDDLCRDPWSGKLLRDELAGLHAFRVRRFRIVYQVQRPTMTIVVVGVGPRRTIYDELATAIRLTG